MLTSEEQTTPFKTCVLSIMSSIECFEDKSPIYGCLFGDERVEQGSIILIKEHWPWGGRSEAPCLE